MFVSACLCLAAAFAADSPQSLEDTAPLVAQGDLPMAMVAGIDSWLNRALAASVAARAALWHRDFSSHDAYNASVEPNRRHLAAIIGAIDAREAPNMETCAPPDAPQLGASPEATIRAIRWQVFRSVYGEGLLLEPSGPIRAQIIALPDCDTSP